jgi:hypothetical protein
MRAKTRKAAQGKDPITVAEAIGIILALIVIGGLSFGVVAV